MLFSFQDHTLLFSQLSKDGNSKLWRLFKKAFPDVTSKLTVLKQLLEWSIAAGFIRLSGESFFLMDTN